MRLIRLSKKVFGFDRLDSCKAYFEHVLPWQEGKFSIEGEGHHIGKDKLEKDETILFCYDGNIVSIAKAKDIEIQNEKVEAVWIKLETLRIFKKPPRLTELESELHNIGYDKKIIGTRGWNIIPEQYEKTAISFLVRKDWEIYDL